MQLLEDSMETKLLQEFFDTNRDKCYIHKINPIMDELKEIKADIKELTRTVLGWSEATEKRFDGRYASKAIEEQVKELKETNKKTASYIFDKIVQIVISALLLYVAFKINN